MLLYILFTSESWEYHISISPYRKGKIAQAFRWHPGDLKGHSTAMEIHWACSTEIVLIKLLNLCLVVAPTAYIYQPEIWDCHASMWTWDLIMLCLPVDLRSEIWDLRSEIVTPPCGGVKLLVNMQWWRGHLCFHFGSSPSFMSERVMVYC